MTQETNHIAAQLQALIRLQHIDSRIDQVNKMRGDLPDEIRDLEDEKAGLEKRIDNARRERMESDVQRKKLALDVAESEGLIKKYEEQQLQVRNNREYDALTKEIESHRQRIQSAHLEVAAMAERDDANAEAIEQAQARLTDLSAILDEKRGELQRVIEETRKEQEHFEGMRETALDGIDPRYLRAYDRLRTRLRDGRAVVALERGAAGGYAVPPQRQVEIRQRNRIIACEHTGRIIVDDALYQETVASLGI